VKAGAKTKKGVLSVLYIGRVGSDTCAHHRVPRTHTYRERVNRQSAFTAPAVQSLENCVSPFDSIQKFKKVARP